ncbi:MAG: Rrf2 family transcriptional regulator, partial [candidate division Zixibacteria bacterium]|nr:Rrf2 family transcriptional regulator [candidate division Zixibacteria bacterium]
MRISSIEKYGLRCLLALAREGENSQLTIPEIARLEGLSASYVSKLLSILRKSGLISSVRGRTGGFRISRPAGQINLLEVLTALGGPLIDPDHCAKSSGQQEICIHLSNCSIHHVLAGLAGYVGTFLSHTMLQSILDNEQMDHVQQIE